MEWAPKVRVNCVTVGYLETEQAGLHFGDEAGIAAVAKTRSRCSAWCARMMSPKPACSSRSPGRPFITGADIAVHGGGELPPFLTAASRE